MSLEKRFKVSILGHHPETISSEEINKDMDGVLKPTFEDYYNEFMKGLEEDYPRTYEFLKIIGFP